MAAEEKSVKSGSTPGNEAAKPKAPKPEAKAGTGKGKKGVGSGTGEVRLAAKGELKISPAIDPRLKTFYHKEVVPALVKKGEFKNPMEVPRLTKVVINCAVKDAVANPKVLDFAFNDVMAITGQKPVLTRAKKAIANFKVRKGNPLAVRVTLRHARMWEFLDRLMNIALPRVRDFKGVGTKSFDGRGNYSLGIREQIIFPEINYDKVDKVRGFSITIVTTARTNEQARALLTELGMPFRK